jgi:hypothetical protein
VAVGTNVEWFIQAVDGSGNVAVTSNRAFIESVVPPESTGDIEAQASGPQTNGWYTDTVAVTISGAPDISYSLDGAPFTAGTSLVVNGTGATRWTSRAVTAPTARLRCRSTSRIRP